MLLQSGSHQRNVLLSVISAFLILILSACNTADTATQVFVGAVVPTRMATETPTQTATPTHTPTVTQTASATPTLTQTPTETQTNTEVPPSETPSPTETATTSSGLPMVTVPANPTLSLGLPPTLTPATNDPINIDPEDGIFEYTGEIRSAVQQVTFTFDAQENDQIDVSMSRSSGDLDPLVLILNEADEIIIENDDDPAGGTRNALIDDFAIPEDGTYTLIATRFQQALGTSQGTFDLTFELTAAEEISTTSEPTPTTDLTDTTLTYGDTVTGTISDENYAVTFEFEGQAGDVVNIRMLYINDDLDPLILLRDENDAVLVQDDDGLGNRNALIGEYTLPRDGTYTIVATRFQQQLGTTEGDFSLELELIQQDA